MFTNQDRAAIAVFMTSMQHERDTKRNFAKLTDTYTQPEMEALIGRFEDAGVLTREDTRYLVKKVSKMYEK